MTAKRIDKGQSIPVTFGNVTFGEEIASIGVKIDRVHFSPQKADETFCGRRIQGTIAAGPCGGNSGQRVMWSDLDHRIDATLESKGVSLKPEYIRATLNLCLRDIEIETLAQFAKRDGLLLIGEVEDLPDGGKE
jgi:hypothetical protein